MRYLKAKEMFGWISLGGILTVHDWELWGALKSGPNTLAVV